MERNARNIMLIAFVAVGVLFVLWLWLGAASMWDKVQANLDIYQDDQQKAASLERESKVYVGAGVENARAALKAATESSAAVKALIADNDAAFKSFFNGTEQMADADFRGVYQDGVVGGNGLAQLPTREKLASLAGTTNVMVTSLVPQPTALNDNQRKALQKQVWIYQRIIYSMLKHCAANGFDGRMVEQLIMPTGATAKTAITIENCDERAEEAKANLAIAGAEPLFYGDKIPEITVSFSVRLDARALEAFLAELAVYDTKNPPIINGQPNPAPIPKLDVDAIVNGEKMKPLTSMMFIVQDVTIARISPADNATAPKPGQVIERTDMKSALEEAAKLKQLLTVDIKLRVLDYNPHSGEKVANRIDAGRKTRPAPSVKRLIIYT